MAYQMVAMTVTLNDLEGLHRLQAFSNATRQTFMQHFTRFQLTACLHGSSALAELLVLSTSHSVTIWFCTSPHGITTSFVPTSKFLQRLSWIYCCPFPHAAGSSLTGMSKCGFRSAVAICSTNIIIENLCNYLLVHKISRLAVIKVCSLIIHCHQCTR